MKNGQEHAGRAVAPLSLDFLPHGAPDSHIGHQDHIRKVFQVNEFFSHDINMVIVHAFPIKGGVIDGLNGFQGLADLSDRHIGGVQFLHDIICRKNRTEGGDAPEGDFIYLGKYILQFEIHLAHGIGLQRGHLGCGNASFGFFFMQIIQEIFVKLVSAGYFFAVINGQKPVVKGIYPKITCVPDMTGQLIERNAVFGACQPFVHISEIQKQPYRGREGGSSQ